MASVAAAEDTGAADSLHGGATGDEDLPGSRGVTSRVVTVRVGKFVSSIYVACFVWSGMYLAKNGGDQSGYGQKHELNRGCEGTFVVL